MATKRFNNHSLEQAMVLLMQNTAVLMQNQTALMQNHATFLAQLAESRKRMADLEEDIRTEFRLIRAILVRHEQILSELPEAIRQKIGFNPAS
jgi:hypothetical protein